MNSNFDHLDAERRSSFTELDLSRFSSREMNQSKKKMISDFDYSGYNTQCAMLIAGMYLPVLPEEFEKQIKTEQKQFQIVGGDEVNIFRGKNLFTAKIEGFIPYYDENSPWVKDEHRFVHPQMFREKIESILAKKWKTKFEYHSANWGIECFVTIEDVTFREEGGTPGDLEYSFTIREHNSYEAKQVQIDSSGNVQEKPSANQSKATTYTVKKGDCLSHIAKAVLGDSSRWREIYELNKDMIKNPNLIFPGQELKMPVDNKGEPSTSE